MLLLATPSLLLLLLARSSGASERVWLLVDPAVVADGGASSTAGWQLELPAPIKEPNNPLLVEDKLWDVRWDNTYPTTRYDADAKLYKMWYNAFIGNFREHPRWASQFPHSTPCKNKVGCDSATLYATSTDGVAWTKPELSVVDYKWNGTAAVSVGPNNMLLLARGNPDRGVMHDAHERNSSRRYKAFGSFWSNLCRGKNSTTPTTAHDGSLFPPCHNLGVAFSADGVHFDHAQDEDAYDPGNVPGLDKVGQNDGALDLAMWDADLGSYWGLVRLDVSITEIDKAPSGFRRTGRFETKDFKTFTAGEQVFHGRLGYEIYTIQPFRLPSYRPGYYLATAMFYNTSSKEGHVNCELLQSMNFGRNWSRIAPEGTQYIPRGANGTFDSHTLYTAWTGDSEAMLDPADAGTTLFYYSGGNGPHSGNRDDSIGLARAKTHAYAGLRAAPSGARPLRTNPLTLACGRIAVLASLHGSTASIKVAAATHSAVGHEVWQRAAPIVSAAAPAPLVGAGEIEWLELSWGEETETELGTGTETQTGSGSDRLFDEDEASVTFELEVAAATVFAIRALC